MLVNTSTGIMVLPQVRFAKTTWQKFRGLMLEKKERFDYALVFDFERETQWGASVHMLFVFFPIDLVYLDEQQRVVDIKRGFQPFSLNYTPTRSARYLIELPAGFSENTAVGDELTWKD